MLSHGAGILGEDWAVEEAAKKAVNVAPEHVSKAEEKRLVAGMGELKYSTLSAT